jgi:hypothetical protein
MIRALVVCLLTLSPAHAGQGDLAGTWTGTITTVGTRLQSTYSPITGVSVTPVPDLRVLPSPFGPLILSGDGRYDMPVLDLSGTWTAEAGTIAFTGGLEGVAGTVEWLDDGPAVTLALPLGDGTSQNVTFRR